MNECQKTGCRTFETRCKECNRLFNEAKRVLPEEPEWININEREPDSSENVLVTDGKRVDWGLYLIKERIWWCYNDSIKMDEITYWMPLPEPPK